MVNRYKNLSLRREATLFIEFQGTSIAGLKEELEVVKEICADNRSVRIESGMGREERNRLWEARYDVHDAIKVNHPGLSPLVIDTAVPVSKYPDMVEWSQKVLAKKGVKGFAFGHAGSGNLHMEILGIPENETEWQTGARGRGGDGPFRAGMQGDGDRRTWDWNREEEVHGKRTRPEPQGHEADQGAPGPQRDHESGEDV